jgi:hypothetical protein
MVSIAQIDLVSLSSVFEISGLKERLAPSARCDGG